MHSLLYTYKERKLELRYDPTHRPSIRGLVLVLRDLQEVYDNNPTKRKEIEERVDEIKKDSNVLGNLQSEVRKIVMFRPDSYVDDTSKVEINAMHTALAFDGAVRGAIIELYHTWAVKPDPESNATSRGSCSDLLGLGESTFINKLIELCDRYDWK